MNYAKPEIVGLATALRAIESGQGVKFPHSVMDTDPRFPNVLSSGAYEADE